MASGLLSLIRLPLLWLATVLSLWKNEIRDGSPRSRPDRATMNHETDGYNC